MTTLPTVFNYDTHPVRTIYDETGIWFVGRDVAAVLGYSNPKDALARHVRDKYKKKMKLEISSGRETRPQLDVAVRKQTRTVTVINEPGVYALVFSSKLEAAQQFQDWVWEEVLPKLRHDGYYSTMSNEQLYATLRKRMKTDPAFREMAGGTRFGRAAIAQEEADRHQAMLDRYLASAELEKQFWDISPEEYRARLREIWGIWARSHIEKYDKRLQVQIDTFGSFEAAKAYRNRKREET